MTGEGEGEKAMCMIIGVTLLSAEYLLVLWDLQQASFRRRLIQVKDSGISLSDK